MCFFSSDLTNYLFQTLYIIYFIVVLTTIIVAVIVVILWTAVVVSSVAFFESSSKTQSIVMPIYTTIHPSIHWTSRAHLSYSKHLAIYSVLIVCFLQQDISQRLAACLSVRMPVCLFEFYSLCVMVTIAEDNACHWQCRMVGV